MNLKSFMQISLMGFIFLIIIATYLPSYLVTYCKQFQKKPSVSSKFCFVDW